MARETQKMWLMWHVLDRGSYARVRCTQSWLCTLACKCAHSSLLGSSALAGILCTLCLTPPFKPHIDGKDLQHMKTLNLAKTLENNKVKGLANIN
jgi:hypothetical protein